MKLRIVNRGLGREYFIPHGILIVLFVNFSTNIKYLTGFMILHPVGMRDWSKQNKT